MDEEGTTNLLLLKALKFIIFPILGRSTSVFFIFQTYENKAYELRTDDNTAQPCLIDLYDAGSGKLLSEALVELGHAVSIDRPVSPSIPQPQRQAGE